MKTKPTTFNAAMDALYMEEAQLLKRLKEVRAEKRLLNKHALALVISQMNGPEANPAQ